MILPRLFTGNLKNPNASMSALGLKKGGSKDDEESFELMMGTDIDGVLRGKLLSAEKFSKGNGDFGFCGVIFGWDRQDTVYTATELVRGLSFPQVWKQTSTAGYPDVIAHIDDGSTRVLYSPQHPQGIRVHLVDFHSQDRSPLPFCPRSTLKRAVNRLKEQFGLLADCGFELEWYNYRGSASSILENAINNPHNLGITSGMGGYCPLRPLENSGYIDDLLQACTKSGVFLECFHTETGPGVLEAALKHSLAMNAADNCQILKWLVKTVAHHHGFSASFMAKPWNDLPGCGGHIHISLIHQSTNGQTSNALVDNSHTKACFMAGILHCLPDLMPFFAPTINSYKRLDLKYWAPILLGWGHDNRLAVLRLIESNRPEERDDTRIEVRIGGADMNPYFALAAIIEAGMYGVRESLAPPLPMDATRLHPNANLLEEINNLGYQALPLTLADAVKRMMHPDSLARQLFPEELIDHFGMTRMHELKSFDSTVTEWERQRYLESA